MHDATEWRKNDEKNVRSDFNEKHQYCMTDPYIIICRAYACGIVLELLGGIISGKQKNMNKIKWNEKNYGGWNNETRRACDK